MLFRICIGHVRELASHLAAGLALGIEDVDAIDDRSVTQEVTAVRVLFPFETFTSDPFTSPSSR
jgi:hypothetical protein